MPSNLLLHPIPYVVVPCNAIKGCFTNHFTFDYVFAFLRSPISYKKKYKKEINKNNSIRFTLLYNTRLSSRELYCKVNLCRISYFNSVHLISLFYPQHVDQHQNYKLRTEVNITKL